MVLATLGGDTTHGPAATYSNDDPAACPDGLLSRTRELRLADDGLAFDLPTGSLELAPNLSYDLADVPTLSSPANDQRRRHGFTTPRGAVAEWPRRPTLLTRHCRQVGRARNAAPTTISQAIPARMPPTTSVK
jgi:hypothetical protein